MDPIAPAASVSAAPRYIEDQRPAADAAATRTDPSPLAPLGGPPALVPHTGVQSGAVARAALEVNGIVGTARDTPRVLKPYGIEMLPRHDARNEGTGGSSPEDDAELDVAQE